MRKSAIAPSTPRLSEVARHVVIPSGIVTTAWPRVVAKCAEIGVTFDEWQHGIGAIALGKRADGKYAATVGGVMLSIPRQVGKTFLVGMIVIGLCLIHPGLTVLWSAHRTRTATKTFGSLKGMTSRKKIKPHMLDPRSTNGEQEIRFKNGSVIMFGAREQGFGRGFDEVDVEVFDEAQILTEKALEDMVPAANQSRHEAGALLLFMGTPPRPTDPGEEFTNRRAKALKLKPEGVVQLVRGNMVFVEFSADEDADPDDKVQWSKANPSYPSRTPEESMERMRENLTDDDSFRREALGIWDDPAKVGGVINARKWAAGAETVQADLSNPVVSVDMRTGAQQSLAIGKASLRSDGRDDIALARYELGADESWARDFALNETLEILRHNNLDWVVIDQYGEGNGILIPMFEDAGIRVMKLNSTDMRNGAVGLVDGFVNGRIVHHNDEPLNRAVAGARTRKSGEGFLWDQLRSGVDITPVRVVTSAWWGLQLGRASDYDVLDSVF